LLAIVDPALVSNSRLLIALGRKKLKLTYFATVNLQIEA